MRARGLTFLVTAYILRTTDGIESRQQKASELRFLIIDLSPSYLHDLLIRIKYMDIDVHVYFFKLRHMIGNK